MNPSSVGVTSLVYQEKRLKDVQLSGTKVAVTQISGDLSSESRHTLVQLEHAKPIPVLRGRPSVVEPGRLEGGGLDRCV